MSASQSPKGGGISGQTTPSHSQSSGAGGVEHLSPGSLIFAKMKSFPAWPAKVVASDSYPGSVPKHHVPVLFLGSGDFGHVATKDCYPYLEYRSQYGTPKQRPKHAEAIREADEMIAAQQQAENEKSKDRGGRKRASPKGRGEKDKSAAADTPSPAKKPRGRPPKSKEDTETEEQQPAAEEPVLSRHDDEELLTTGKFLPASQLAEIAASTVFESEPDSHASAGGGETITTTQQSPPRGTEDPDEEDEEEEDVDDAISNVVRQLEELEKQEADEQRRSQAHSSPTTDTEGGSSTAPKRRGRPPKKQYVAATPESTKITRPSTLATESAKKIPMGAFHTRSLSETTDDGRGGGVGFGRQSSGSETPLSGGEGGQLGKRRHKPKIMSEYFLEKDYTSPRTHKKSESASATTIASTPLSPPMPTKLQQSKASKTPTVERQTKLVATRPKKTLASLGMGSGSKLTKEKEKAALEEEVERVKLAAEENQTEQHSSTDQQLWQRHEAFSDLPFDDSMFEVTVDVEESPSGGGGGSGAQAAFGGETSSPLAQAMAKRRRDAAEMAKQKERMKLKPKLKVKLLKGPMPPPRHFTSITADGRKRKEKPIGALAVAAKKKKTDAGKMKVKIAKQRATKAAKVVAAAELKVKKKRGRKPLLEKRLKLEKGGVSGYSLFAEHEMESFKQEHPDVKGKKSVREMLQLRYDQLPEDERQEWENRANSLRGADTSPKKGKGQQNKSPASASPRVSMEGKGFFGRPGGTATSPKGYVPSSPRTPRRFMSSPHGASSGMEIDQQQLTYDQGTPMVGAEEAVYDQMDVTHLAESTYGASSELGAQPSYVSSYGMHGQQDYSHSQPTSTPTPTKRGRGRPPKNPRPVEGQPKAASQPQLRPSELASQPDSQGASALLGYQRMSSLPKGLKIPKKESAAKAAAAQQQKPPLKILTVGQRRAPFQARSPQSIMQHSQVLLQGSLDDPPVPEAMSHEELVYDSETAALAAAAAAAMDLANSGIMTDEGVIEEVAYGHVDQRGHHHHHEELGEETEAAVSFLTGDDPSSIGQPPKSKAQLEEERAARKRESRRRSRAKQRALKEQKKMDLSQGSIQQQTPPRHQKQRELAASTQYGAEPSTYGTQAATTTTPAVAYEVAYAEPRPSEEETNMFFFGTTQDVQALLEVRNPPAAMEGQCRWWLADEADPELHGVKGKNARGSSPPRALTAEPLDAAAVFKLIGRAFETVGNQLMREEGEDSPHEIAAGMDMLLDSMVSSISHLLTLTGSVPPFERRYRRDVLSRLVEETSMMIPL